VVGKALQDGYREKVKLATKLPTWMVKGPEDFDRILDEQLRKLQTDHIDFYLLHALNSRTWQNIVLKFDLLGKAAAALADGRIRHLGFSFHDEYKVFEEIVNSSNLWDFCQIQYNYMGIETQAGTRGLKLAASKGLAVVVMEPLMGGRMLDPPKDARELLEHFPAGHSLVEWAFQWLWDQPEVSVVLSGMNTIAQVDENVHQADVSRIGAFGNEEQELLAKVREKYHARTVIPCTKCSYCMPCPNGVNIPRNFDLFNYAHLFDDTVTARFNASIAFKPEQRASACIGCRECEEKCPQKIPVSEWMPKVAALLA
jgi:predicted aldo/keto reductase-like oxidoreductase